MPNKSLQRFLQVYRWLVSISILVCGGCLIAACLSIYYSGVDAPYTQASVAAAFSRIALPVYLCIGLTLGNLVLTLILPKEDEKIKKTKDLRAIRDRLASARELSLYPDTEARIRHARKKSHILCSISVGLCTFCGLIFLNYALDGSHWGSDSSASMVQAMYRLIPCLAAIFAAVYFAVQVRNTCLELEISLLRALPKAEVPVSQPDAPASHWAAAVPWCLLAIAIGLVVLGACTGGIEDVLAKATEICKECIGLG